MSTNIPIDEFVQSLTGYDEIAINKAFGVDWTVLMESQPTTFSRALVFTDLRHQGKTDTESKKTCMEMSIKQVGEYFPQTDAADELDEDNESGKDD